MNVPKMSMHQFTLSKIWCHTCKHKFGICSCHKICNVLDWYFMAMPAEIQDPEPVPNPGPGQHGATLPDPVLRSEMYKSLGH